MISSPLLNQLGGFVDGRWIGAGSGATLSVVNPATGELLARVPDMNAADGMHAVESAVRAFTQIPEIERRRSWLVGIADLLTTHRSELARIITLEQGKPLREA